jgi:hypothetical protein|tara:strand:- start:8862 stop:10505 length:1644 start_codon:yes stop_codon:yes gene_type:complete
MSYENPQRIVNKAWDIFARQTQQRNNQISSDLSAALKKVANNKERNKRSLEALEQDKLNYASKLDSIDTSQSGAMFDDNLRMFFDSQIDKYFNVKNAMRKGDVDKREGNRILTSMNRQVEKFKTFIPDIINISNQVYDQANTSGQQGGISAGTTPPEVIDIFGSIAKGENVYTVEDPKTGNIWLMKMPAKVEEKFMADGTIDDYEMRASLNDQLSGGEGSLVNLDEVMKLGPKNMVQYTTNLDKFSTPLTDEVIGNDINNGYYQKSESITLSDDGESSKTETSIFVNPSDAKKMREDIIKLNGFSTMLNDTQSMKSVWVDLMPDSIAQGNWTNTPEQRDKARNWMVDDSVAKLLLRQGLIQGHEVDGKEVPLLKEGTGDLLDRLIYIKEGETKVIDIENTKLNELTKQESVSIQSLMPKIETGYNKLLKDFKFDQDSNNYAGDDLKSRFSEQVANALNTTVGGGGIESNTYSIDPENPGVIKSGKKEYKLFAEDGANIREDVILQLLGIRSGLGAKTAAKVYKNYSKFSAGKKEITDINLLPSATIK